MNYLTKLKKKYQILRHKFQILALLKKGGPAVIFLVINNSGGAIFSFLPYAEKKESFEEFFAASHSFHFSHAARLFDLPYYRPQNQQEWQELLPFCLNSGQSCLIEVCTQRDENVRIHQALAKAIDLSFRA